MIGDTFFYDPLFIFDSRFFMDTISMTCHQKSKLHKKRVKCLQGKPYTMEEAERAAGLTK